MDELEVTEKVEDYEVVYDRIGVAVKFMGDTIISLWHDDEYDYWVHHRANTEVADHILGGALRISTTYFDKVLELRQSQND